MLAAVSMSWHLSPQDWTSILCLLTVVLDSFDVVITIPIGMLSDCCHAVTLGLSIRLERIELVIIFDFILFQDKIYM